MKSSKFKIDNVVQQLNENKNVSRIVLATLKNWGLSEEEKTFIKTHKPEKALIIYGTLAPGRPNHLKVQHIRGEWKKGIVRGKLENKGWGAEMGYNGFEHTSSEEQESIAAFVLISDELVTYWQMLDEFEGEGYRRILAKYELENGETGIGYIYALNEA